MNIINFDHNASTQVSPLVLARINEIYSFGANSSSSHGLGRKAAMIIEGARQDLSNALNAANYEIYFTSGGTEANNMALFSDDFEQIFYAKFEHSSVYNVRPRNCEIIDFAVDSNGVIDLNDLQNKLAQTKSPNFLVSIMLANNETGAVQPLREAAKLVHRKGGLIHSDLVQAFGKIRVDLEDLNLDFATVSSHKINGPQGVGAFLVRRGIDVRPMIFGGGHERGKRSGTMNNAAIAGFGVAIQELEEKFSKLNKIRELRDFIESEIKKIGGQNVIFFSQNVLRTPNTSYFALRNADSQTQLIHFDLNQIMISAGSACSSGAIKASRVLQSMNIAPEFSNAIRISLGCNNTKDEALRFIEIWKEFHDKIIKK